MPERSRGDVRAMLDEMIGRALRHADGGATVLERLRVRVSPGATGPAAAVHAPMLHLVLQGAKRLAIGDRVLRYDPASCFVGALHLAVSGHVIDATPARPFVALSLALDIDGLAEAMPDLAELPPEPGCPAPGFTTAPVTPALLDPCCRLLRLLDQPDDAPALAPLLEREILYRLARAPHGAALRQLARADSRLSRIRRAIGWIRRHYDRPLRIDHVAGVAAMSPATLHRHFRAATGMSPLQYQKSLRLQQARLRLLGGGDAGHAGHAVGYASPSQFSREYARMFGEPPARDRRRLLGAPAAGPGGNLLG